MKHAEYVRLGASDIAHLVSTGELSATEVLLAALAAIETLNPDLNAVVAVYAEAAAAQIERGLPRGPLQGVPVLLKDLGCPAAHTRTTFGSALFKEAPLWTHDCAFVTALKRAGAVIVGRTNSCEFGVSLITEPVAYGPTRNPRARELSTGGSSGGSAAAVAAGMVPLAHATDGCGSIRVPASHCGLVGLKPSRGRISFSPDVGESWGGMSVNGALTRSVEDAALWLEVTAAPFPGDPYFLAPPVRARASRRLRIGVPWFLFSRHNVDAECGAAVQSAADACGRLGHEIIALESFEGEWMPACEPLSVIWGTQLWVQLQARYRELGQAPDGSGIEPLSWALASVGRQASAADYLSAVRSLHAFGRRLATWFARCDAVLTPVTARKAWPLGELSMNGADARAYLAELLSFCPFTVQLNMAGCPAIAVPVRETVGVQLGAKLGDEALLLDLAQNLLAPI